MTSIPVTLQIDIDALRTLFADLGIPAVNGTQTNDDEEAGSARSDAETDAKGVPWQSSYHSANRSVNADGTWRMKRGLSDEQKAGLAEFEKQYSNAPAVTAAPVLPGVTAAEPIPAPAAPPVTMDAVIARFQELAAQGVLSVATINEAVYNPAGVTDPAILNTDETARARVMARMEEVASGPATPAAAPTMPGMAG